MLANADLQTAAKRSLWGHFTPLGVQQKAEIPIITRGEGPWIFDQHGKRYLDGLSGLFVVQVGHGRAELAAAASAQSNTLAYFPLWTFGHEPAIQLADRLGKLAPGDLNRVFFTTGGSEAVESAWKLAVQYFQAIGQPGRHKVISRNLAYHGTTLGALAVTGIPSIKGAFEPLLPPAVKVATPYRYRCRDCAHLSACTLRCADDIEDRILMEGPESVAAVVLEPMQNSGGGFVPPPGYFERVREICDTYGVLLISDEVICAFGRLGEVFGADHYGYQPDMITFAKGVTSGYAALGGVIVSDRIAGPFIETDDASFMHGLTFGGHPVSCAVAMANLDLFEELDVLNNVRTHKATFDAALAPLADLPIVGEIRGDGFYRAIELTPDKSTKALFDDADGKRLLAGLISPRMWELGLYCRADDRGEPVITLAPPLVCGEEEFAFIGEVLHTVLTEASASLGG